MMKPKLQKSSSALMSAFSALNKKTKKKKTLKAPELLMNNGSSSEGRVRKPSKKRKRSETKQVETAPSSVNGTDANTVPCGNIPAEKCFEWLIAPVAPEVFFKDIWEQKPLHIKRKEGLDNGRLIFTTKEFDKIMRNNHLEYKKNIDIVLYENQNKEDRTPDGRVYPAVVWDYFQNGCSIRLLNPQTYSANLWRMNSLLQEFFGSFVGANMYLTPPNSQGFAPHYDDIEAFVLQLEGKKLWKVYSPRLNEDFLARFSSKNFTQEEIGQPIMEVELQPGDLLYFPRGFIHQASTVGEEHSLHLTISTCQRNTWADLLELMLPRALQLAIDEDIEFRQSLPKDYMNYVGVANAEKECPERDAFFSKMIQLTKRVAKYLPIDSAADQKAKEFIHSSLPPHLIIEEKEHSIHSSEALWTDNGIKQIQELEPDTEIRFIRKRAQRLVMEDETVKLYHTLENSRVYQEKDAQYVEMDASQAPAVEHLFHTYPDFVRIEDLPLLSEEQRMDIANLLYDKGLLMRREPSVSVSESDSK